MKVAHFFFSASKKILPGILFYLVIAVSFVFIANDNSFRDLLKLPSFYSDVFFALLTTLAVGLYVHLITVRLDRKHSWRTDFRSRFSNQFFLAFLLPLIAAMVLEMGYLYVIRIPISQSGFWNLELPLAALYLLVINLFYFSRNLFLHREKETAGESLQDFQPIHFLTVQKGFAEEKIAIEDCAYIKSSNKVLWLQTFNDEQFRIKGTLEELEELLTPHNFYRLNRQYLAAHSSIQSIEPDVSRKIRVHFSVPAREEVTVSKTNAVHFRNWWKNGRPLE